MKTSHHSPYTRLTRQMTIINQTENTIEAKDKLIDNLKVNEKLSDMDNIINSV